MTTPIDPDELIANDTAAKKLKQQPSTLTAWRNQKRGPPYVKVGRQVFYRRSDLMAWLATQRHEPQTMRAKRA
jgi:helix-turn-helix protein